MGEKSKRLTLGTKFQDELQNQNKYLEDHGRKRHEVIPDENCFFRAVHVSAQQRIANVISEYRGHTQLRKEAIEHILDHMADFIVFFPGKGKESRAEIRKELMELKDNEAWPGYESVMAVSRLLNVRVLVTSGGSAENPKIHTIAYSFGEDIPENYVHIAWLSLGYYDAVVLPNERMEGRSENPFEDINKYYSRESVTFMLCRHPSHICYCRKRSACHCSNYQSPAKEFGKVIKKRSVREVEKGSGKKAQTNVDMTTYFANTFQRELDGQDEYLESRGLRRFGVSPDANSFFRAVAISANINRNHPTESETGHQELREKVTQEIEDNVGRYRPLFSDLKPGDGARSVLQKCETLAERDTWVGFQCLMAATRALETKVLVTYGASDDCPDVITTAFYFGDYPPEGTASVHIVWVSLGYYDAVIPKEVKNKAVERKEVNIFKEIGEYKRSDFSSRYPIHLCRCGPGSSCSCRKYRYLVSDTELIPAKKKEYPAGGGMDFDDIWSDIFSLVCKEALVLSSWKTLLRRLRLPHCEIVELEKNRDSIGEKLHGGLSKWLMLNSRPKALSTFEKVEDALRREHFNRCADDMLCQFEALFK